MTSRKETREQWLTSEEALLREHYPTRMPMLQIVAMLPRHTRQSIRVHAQKMGMKRPLGMRDEPRPVPAWDRICSLIERTALSRSQISERLGVTKQAVAICLDANRTKWHVADWIAPVAKGRPTALIALGDGEDALYEHRTATRAQIAARAMNPFLVAAGAVAAPTSHRGRVISMMDEPETV
ncbi:Uncharacterised protein [Burkholderia pseudomallei]|nr:Uncharacterised protein [Burkholderia pseudomallei]